MLSLKAKRVTAKILAVLVCALSITVVPGCREKTETTEKQTKNSFTYWCNMPAGIVSVYQSMGEVKMLQQLEKESGYTLTLFILPQAGKRTVYAHDGGKRVP